MPDDRWTADGERIFRELNKLSKLMVAIGFQHGEATYENGADVCDVAAFNEFGTDHGTYHIPSRPFMRQSVDLNEDEITEFLQKKVDEIIGGKTAEQVLKEIGIFQKDLVQTEIEEGDFEENKESTILRKGSDHPLIDTGLMLQSVNYQIKKKGG